MKALRVVAGLSLLWSSVICLAEGREDSGLPGGIPGCAVDPATREAQPPFYPFDTSATGTVSIVVWPAPDGTVAVVRGADNQTAGARIVVSSRNRPLDRAALDAARGWRYICRDGLKGEERWARVDVVMSPATTRSSPTPPKFPIDQFPDWVNAARSTAVETSVRDDSIIPFSSVEQAARELAGDHRYIAREINQRAASYSGWNGQASTSETWWLRRDEGRMFKALVLVRVDYRVRRLTFGAVCEGSAQDCADFIGIVSLSPANWAVDRVPGVAPGTQHR